MAPNLEERMTARKILVNELNLCITCSLCRGYLIDATSLVDCLHVFCRACILRYFENSKLACPTCNILYKKKNNPCFRSDPIIQSLVYKLVPALYSKEVQRREDFYRSTGVRAGSSCSEDSVLGDLNEEHDEWVLSTCSDQNQYLSPDDAISLSLEYYQSHLDTTDEKKQPPSDTESTNFQETLETKVVDEKPSDLNNSANLSADKTEDCDNNNSNNINNNNASVNSGNNDQIINGNDEIQNNKIKSENGNNFVDVKGGDRRYLQCPAAVTMSLLQKFLRMKYALSAEHRVDIIHSGEVLPSHFNLMDIAYTFKWQRTKPMRFFYRIFTPAKIQPIKIISTPSSGGKQLQVVLAKTNISQLHQQTHQLQQPEKEETKESLSKAESEAQHYRNKERLMANLQLQSKSKLSTKSSDSSSRKHEDKRHSHTNTEEEPGCVYEYEEPDKDEIRAFAEKRDREWALQKQLDEEREKHRNSKKRKKNKHSKNSSLHKKQKLHAEITSSEEKEESLKLKVKLTPHNGYKHKHHKSSQSQVAMEPPKPPEMSSKEKLLQMRQVRHKHISTEDKNKSAYQNTNNSSTNTEEVKEKSPIKNKEEHKPPEISKIEKPEIINRLRSPEPTVKATEPQRKPQEPPAVLNKATQSPPKPVESPKQTLKEPAMTSKTLRSDFSIKTNATKELCMKKYPTVQLERNEQTERQAQKTFLKTFQSYTEKLSQNSDKNPIPPKPRHTLQNTYPGKNNQNFNAHTSKSLEQKIATLHQQCTTVEAKPIVRQEAPKADKKLHVGNEKPQILNTQYSSSGFTVSKVEAGAKRKLESEEVHDKRPSLEITLINPTPLEKPNTPSDVKHVAKRPPPPTIPLERIKKSMNRMSGISIIPKLSDRCDNSGALDLSKPSKSMEITAKSSDNTANKILNGLSLTSGRPQDRLHTPDKNIQLSNLQMLSKVALEHPNINKNQNVATVNKKPPMPSLQTLKIPVPQNPNAKSNLAKMPKLNEINKTQFRMPNPQLRNMRPNQNQSVRNIPNPSLLVRQQNQNRLNSLNCSSQNSSTDNKEQNLKPNGSNSDGVNSSEKNENKEKVVKDEKEQNNKVNNVEKKVSV